MEAGYIAVYLWKAAVEKAGIDRRREGQGGRRTASRSTRPRARSPIDGENQHIYKTARIGKIGSRRPDQRGLELRASRSSPIRT